MASFRLVLGDDFDNKERKILYLVSSILMFRIIGTSFDHSNGKSLSPTGTKNYVFLFIDLGE